VDTTGAGDIFHGAFTYCIHKSYPLQDALIIASATSAISVQTLGGQTSIPTKAAVNRFLNEQCCHLILK
jgi:sulfofructose kinase